MYRSSKIMQLCIKNNYYTCGSSSHYNEMLKNCDNGLVNSIFIAYDIYFHSDIETRPQLGIIVSQVKAILEPEEEKDWDIFI